MSNRYFGGIISAFRVTTSGVDYTGQAGGMWNTVQYARTKRASAWPLGQGVREPLDPTVNLITFGNQSITVNYSAPSYDGGSPITSYTIVAISNAIPSTTLINVEPATATTSTLYGLTNGLSYDIYVYATNSYGSTKNYTTYYARQLPSIANSDQYYSSTALILTGSEVGNVDNFYDSSPLHNIPVKNDNPIISFDQYIDGFSSMFFDGISAYLYYSQVFRNIPYNYTAYTIEFWWYPTSLIVNNGVIAVSINAKSNNASVITVGANYTVAGTTLITGIAQPPINTWRHIAISSNGSSLYLFVNGTLVNTTTVPTTSLSNCSLTIGASSVVPSNFAPGWIDSFRVTSGVARYTSAFTPSASVTGNTTPIPPTNIVASTGSGQSIITFTPSTFNGAVVLSYTAISIPGGLTGIGASSPITVNGLSNGTSYQFRVIATNTNGSSYASALSNTIQPNPPSVPSTVVITDAVYGNSSATISFTYPLNFGGSTCAYTAISTPGDISATSLTSPLVVNGLTNGVSYTFTITAANATGVGSISNTSVAVIPATVPDAPTITGVTSFDKTATISFTPNANNGGDAAYSFTVATGNITATGSSSPITITGLTNGVSYTFTVTATNKAGTSVASAISSSTIPLPPMPVAPTLTASSINSTATKTFILSWNVDPVCTYQVYDSNNNALPGVTSTGQVITSQYNGAVFLSENSYSFYVRATNLKGSTNSNTLTVTIPRQDITFSFTYTVGSTIDSTWLAERGWDTSNQALQATLTINMQNTGNPGGGPGLTINLPSLHASTYITIASIPQIYGVGGAGGTPNGVPFDSTTRRASEGFSPHSGSAGGTAIYVYCNSPMRLIALASGTIVGGGGGAGTSGGSYGGSGGQGGTGLVLSGSGPFYITNPQGFFGGGGGGAGLSGNDIIFAGGNGSYNGAGGYPAATGGTTSSPGYGSYPTGSSGSVAKDYYGNQLAGSGWPGGGGTAISGTWTQI